MLVALRILRLQLLQLHPSLAESMLVQAGQGLRVTLLEPETSLVYRTYVLRERAFGLAHHLTNASIFDHNGRVDAPSERSCRVD